MPPSDTETALLKSAVHALDDLLVNGVVAADLPDALKQDPQFQDLLARLSGLQQFALAISHGDLNVNFTGKGYMAGCFKNLQSSLRHLSWQTQMVARGDFSQRIEFMGEFSAAFNTMVASLAAAQQRQKQHADDLAAANLTLSQEIADRKRAEAELQRLHEQTRRDAQTKADLLKEVNHRVKNNLTAILGLILNEKRHVPAAGRPFVDAVIGNLNTRVRSLLHVHQLLSDCQWAPVRVNTLAERILLPSLKAESLERTVNVDIAPSPIEISPRQAGNLALVFSELVHNTLKHALPTQQTIHIAVQAATDGDTVVIRYRDNGPGFPAEVLNGHQANVGLGLIRQLVMETLRGTLALANDHGAVITLRLKTEEDSRT